MDIAYSESKRDISISNGDLVFVNDEVDLLMQRLFLRLKTFNRELFWDKTYGIDYINDVLGRAKVKSTIDAIFKNEITNEPMVKELTDFSSSIQSYAYQCAFKVKVNSESNTVATFYLLQTESGINLLNESGDGLVVKLV